MTQRRYNSAVKSRIMFWLVIGPLSLVLLVGFWLQQGGWMDISPKYEQQNLLGLTVMQVIQKLGTPTNDPRVPRYAATQPEWVSEAINGTPLYLAYYQGWNTCVIWFRNDRVTRVDMHWK